MQTNELAYDEAYRQKVLKSFMADGYIEEMPSQYKKRLVLYAEILKLFQFDRDYPEREVNEIIATVYGDYCTTRREFVELRWMTRTREGVYRRVAEEESTHA